MDEKIEFENEGEAETPVSLKRHRECEDAVFIAMELGEMILRSGGEVSRAEDTVSRICTAYGAVTVDVTAILSVIVLTVDFGDVSLNSSRRLADIGGTNLGRLSKLNDLSRRICRRKPTKKTFLIELERINRESEVTWLKYLVGGVLSASGFAVFFGGSLVDALFAGIIAVPMCVLARKLGKTKINAIIAKVLVCFFGGFAAMLVGRCGVPCNVNMIMIGDIMNVVPGVLLANSFRDLFSGDIMSGFFRMCTALLDGVAIACGYAIAILMLGGAV